MSIAARHIQSPRSRGAQCGIRVAHRWIPHRIVPPVGDMSMATHPIPALQRSAQPVGVGCPNPLGEAVDSDAD